MADPRQSQQGNMPNLPPERYYGAYDFFTYELDFSALANGANATSSFNIQSDADFLWTKAAFFADIAAAAQTDSSKIVPLCTVLISETGSSRQLSNIAVPLPNIFGYGDLPFILPRQRIFVANSTVTVTVTNFSAASTYNLRLSFIGEKAFRSGGVR